MIKVLLLFLLLCNTVVSGMYPEPANATFSSWLSFGQGSGSNQVMWLSEDNGNMVDGPFQGPMAFITDSNDNLWIGDSLNARIIAFTSNGSPGREFDLAAAGQKLGLATAPLLVDLVSSGKDKVLVADAIGNQIIEVDVQHKKARYFRSPPTQNPLHWLQINRLHSDGQGRIYIEDLARRQTVITDSNGRPLQALAGQTGLAVAESARIALLSASDDEQVNWQVLTCEQPGGKLSKLASLNAENPIIWCSLIGYDSQERLHLVFDTQLARHYLALDLEGRIVSKSTTLLHDPGYDVNRPDWIDKNGKIHTLQVKAEKLTVLRLD